MSRDPEIISLYIQGSGDLRLKFVQNTIRVLFESVGPWRCQNVHKSHATISGCNFFPKRLRVHSHIKHIDPKCMDFNGFCRFQYLFSIWKIRRYFFSISVMSAMANGLCSRPLPRWIATAFVLEVSERENMGPTKRESRKLLKHTLGGDYLSFQEVII